MLCCTNSFAKILTVSNIAQQPAMYDNLTAAEAAAVSGDTILVQGSATAYRVSGFSFTVTKKIHLIQSLIICLAVISSTIFAVSGSG